MGGHWYQRLGPRWEKLQGLRPHIHVLLNHLALYFTSNKYIVIHMYIVAWSIAKPQTIEFRYPLIVHVRVHNVCSQCFIGRGVHTPNIIIQNQNSTLIYVCSNQVMHQNLLWNAFNFCVGMPQILHRRVCVCTVHVAPCKPKKPWFSIFLGTMYSICTCTCRHTLCYRKYSYPAYHYKHPCLHHLLHHNQRACL